MRTPFRSLEILIALALIVMASCNAAPDKRLLQYLNTDGFGNRYIGNAEEENYIAIGDTVTVFDALHADQFPAGTGGKVEIDGTVLLPEVGAVHVAGYTRSNLEAYLTQVYSPYYDATDIKVKIATRGKEYFIFGEISKEGAQNFEGDLTIFEAVMGAGPDEKTANLGRVRLIRADPIDPLIIYVNVGDMLDSGDSTFNVHVQERDIIFVPPTMWAQFAYFLEDLFFPIEQVIRSLSGAIFLDMFGVDANLGGRGGRRRGNRRRF